MATSSFDAQFIIRDKTALKNLERALDAPSTKKSTGKFRTETDRGVKELHRKLSRSV